MKKQLLFILTCATTLAALDAQVKNNGKMNQSKQQMQEKFFEITVDNTRSNQPSYVNLHYNNSIKRMNRKIPAGEKLVFTDQGYCLDEIQVKYGKSIIKPEIEKEGMFCGQYTIEIRPDTNLKEGFKVNLIKGKPKPGFLQKLFNNKQK